MTSASYKGRSPFLAMLLAGALGVLGGCSSEPEQLAVEGSAKADKLTQCVKPTEYMRRNHMELIKHQRDVTVHQGVRATDDSLAGCVDCHARYDQQGHPVPVDAEGQFCDGCHDYTAVHLDCFQCHASVPQSAQTAASNAMGGQDMTLAQLSKVHGGLPRVEQEKGN